MSTSTVVMRDRLPPEDAAQWRRMAFNTTEEVVMTEDDPEQPTVITWTFPDGLDENITPSSRVPQARDYALACRWYRPPRRRTA